MTSLFRNGSRRILAVWFPYLATERIWRQRLGRSWRSIRCDAPPLVISRREDNTQRVAALDERARALKLKPGMGIADARAMHPSIDVVEAEPDADLKLLQALADWCDRYTPLVALDAVEGLFLDIAGCAHLFGGEETMLADLVRQLAGQGFHACAGLASTPGAAWAAARHRLPPVDPGEEAEALAPLPLAALRLDEATRLGLESVGLRTVGQIAAAPRAPLARRFGQRLVLRLDQAFGQVEESIEPRLPVPPLAAERHLAEPVLLVEDIERLLLVLALSLKADLERRGEGARRLQLALFRVDGIVWRIAVGTSRPVRDPATVAKLFHERLATCGTGIDAGYGFDLVRLAVLDAVAFEAAQGDLEGRAVQAGEDLALFADRVRARLGDDAIRRAVLVESHMPERAVALLPFAEDTGPRPRPAAVVPGPAKRPLERPVRLFRQPEPVEVMMAEIPEGPPTSFRWRRTRHRIAAAEGPERIAPEWWTSAMPEVEKGSEDAAERSDEQRENLRSLAMTRRTASLTRDYFRVEDETGRRYWLYREGFYGEGSAPPRWFMQGLFA
ncbi:MAG: DNA polymerase Y family protein [Rhizobiaceae bacterium]|nr:DNA polymerase Y family protein [Rhizobiaceae bacterium]